MTAIRICISLLVVGLVQGPHAAHPQAPATSAEELAIIAAAVDSFFMRPDASRVVIESPTAVRVGDAIRAEVGRLAVPNGAADDIARRNAIEVDIRGLVRLIRSRTPIAFVSADSLRRLPRGNPDVYWKAFYSTFPGSTGLVTVSRPGVSADGHIAVVGIGIGCGGRCGHWGYALLAKAGDRWQVTRFVVNRGS